MRAVFAVLLFIMLTSPQAWSQGATSSSAPAAAATGPKPKIKIPKAIRFKDMKAVYQSSLSEPHILMIMHLPVGGKGEVFLEVYNRTKTEIGIFQFTLVALGHEGEIEFEDLPAGWSAVKSVQLSSLKELRVRTPRAFDREANDIAPPLLIHVIDQAGQKLQVGKRQN